MQNIKHPQRTRKQNLLSHANLTQNKNLRIVSQPGGTAMGEVTPRSRVGDLIDRLKRGGSTSEDPFDPDYYDVEAAIKRRDNEEPALALAAVNAGRARSGLPPLLTLDDNGDKIWHHGQKVGA